MCLHIHCNTLEARSAKGHLVVLKSLRHLQPSLMPNGFRNLSLVSFFPDSATLMPVLVSASSFQHFLVFLLTFSCRFQFHAIFGYRPSPRLSTKKDTSDRLKVQVHRWVQRMKADLFFAGILRVDVSPSGE